MVYMWGIFCLCGPHYSKAVSGKIFTADNLKRGMLMDTISDLCSSCGEGRELIDHLFVHCVVPSLWCCFFQWCGSSWCLLGSLSSVLLDVFPFLWLWCYSAEAHSYCCFLSIWKEKNMGFLEVWWSDDLLSRVHWCLVNWLFIEKNLCMLGLKM